MPTFSNFPKESSKQVLQLMHSQRDHGKGFFSVLGHSEHHSQQSWRLGEEGRGGWGKALPGSALLLSHLCDLDLAAVNTWGNNSKETQRKRKTKKADGLYHEESAECEPSASPWQEQHHHQTRHKSATQRGPAGQLRSPPAWPEVWHGMLKWMFMELKAPFLCPLGLRVPLVWCVCK